jgi:uncharacterized delta-60 repeat protein
MNTPTVIRRAFVLSLVLALGACGGGGGDDEENTLPAPPPAQTGIGPAGGTVTGPNGARIEIPPGALASNVDIRIEQSSAGAPPLPANFAAFGQMFAFLPHGTTFAAPVTVTLPFDPALVPAGMTPGFYKTNAQNQWERITNATAGTSTVTAQITSFSLGEVGIERGAPNRQWLLKPTGQDEETGPRNGQGNLVDLGGEIKETRNFGLNSFLTVDDDPNRSMEVFSSATGRTFWAFSEDSGEAELRQSQKFFKRETPASLRFIITEALLEAVDKNGPPLPQECPNTSVVCGLLQGHISFSIEAYTPLGNFLRNSKGEPILDANSTITLLGHEGSWEEPFFGREVGHTKSVWKRANFTFVRDVIGSSGQSHPQVKLIEPVVINVDLSDVPDETEFRIITTITAFTRPRGGESEIVAYVRDPAGTDGVVMEFTGLDLIDEPFEEPVPLAPVPCSTGTDPEAGVLQFNAAAYAQLEEPFSGFNSRGAVLVTRTQGSKGAVSATLTASGGTATPGVHFAPLTTSVQFGDGDTEPHVVEVQILTDDNSEADRTLNLTLSEPGGCAALGSQSTALLTIVDDDRPVTPPPSGLDGTFGSEGKATSAGFGGDRSAMALQADGKIVMVGGTFTDFVLARFTAGGQLDPGFDGDGKVTTNFVSGEVQEALGVVIQSDGKIVVVGHTGQTVGPTVVALARYDTDGSLDESFGSGGKVISTIAGRAFAVALQSGGRIVVAGDDPAAGDIMLARFGANGALDTSFGDGGRIFTDVSGNGDIATNLALQSNGAILVSGGSSVGAARTVLARYDADGEPDDTFGDAGELLLSGLQVGEGLAVQSDGKIVLVGKRGSGVDTAFATMRLNADGSFDDSFGDDGTAATAFSTLGDEALAVTLQGNGKIVVAGRSSLQTNSKFAVARYDANGTLDTTFNTDGMLTVDFFGFTDFAESVAVQPDGKIVLGGLARDNVDGYGVARIIP